MCPKSNMNFSVKCLLCLWDAFIDPVKLCSLLVPTSRLSDDLAFLRLLLCFASLKYGKEESQIL